MVVATPSPIRSEKIREMDLPVIDLSGDRLQVSKLIVQACEEFGFFKVINHGVPDDIIKRMEDESLEFFAKPGPDKQRGGPANPYGYGSKNIGFNGDTGEVEYLILQTNPVSISQYSNSLFNHPSKFSTAVNGYVAAVKRVACEILELIAEGLGVPQTSVFSELISDVDSDSLLRLNHYPSLPLPLQRSIKKDDTSPPSTFHRGTSRVPTTRVGFGEHSDPQILTVLRSNGVGGLQISLEDGVWIPVAPDPIAFCVNVGDLLQAMTNGRFVSVRHRALANSYQSRMSMAYFGGPPAHAKITCPPELVTQWAPSIYRPFTWAEYKKTTYSLRLGDSRLNLFKVDQEKNEN